MFRCQFSGEVSDGAEYRYQWVKDDDVKQSEARRLECVCVRHAETPVKIVVQWRRKVYTNQYGEVIGEGREIAKELTIRAKHLEAVKHKYGLS